MENVKKAQTLLLYQLGHNELHLNELASILQLLPDRPKAKLMQAIGDFEAANVELQTVLDLLNE